MRVFRFPCLLFCAPAMSKRKEITLMIDTPSSTRDDFCHICAYIMPLEWSVCDGTCSGLELIPMARPSVVPPADCRRHPRIRSHLNCSRLAAKKTKTKKQTNAWGPVTLPLFVRTRRIPLDMFCA